MHCVAGTKEKWWLYAQPGSKARALSVRVQYLAQCELICPVPAEDFYPARISAVVRLRPRQLSRVCLDPTA